MRGVYLAGCLAGARAVAVRVATVRVVVGVGVGVAVGVGEGVVGSSSVKGALAVGEGGPAGGASRGQEQAVLEGGGVGAVGEGKLGWGGVTWGGLVGEWVGNVGEYG